MRNKRLDFSILFFSADGSSDGNDKYQMIFDTTRYADEAGFKAVWLPERHFEDFGGLYPNPAVLAASLASVTNTIAIRAGSVVLPLHSVIRVAEEWAMVDNLSHGRVGIAFATGWHIRDFVLSPHPHAYERRRELLQQGLTAVRQLWKGKAIEVQDEQGTTTSILTLPRPVQHELPLWMTTSGNPATWELAARMGVGVLCALSGQTFRELAEKINLYHTTFAQCHENDGLKPHITLMLHTYIGDDEERIRQQVREPLYRYLSDFLAQRRTADEQHRIQMTPEMQAQLLEIAFERFLATNSLIGTVPTCVRMVNKIQELGVDEIACLVDFGLHPAQILNSLKLLDLVRYNNV